MRHVQVVGTGGGIFGARARKLHSTLCSVFAACMGGTGAPHGFMHGLYRSDISSDRCDHMTGEFNLNSRENC
jgi:hypothetical protein